MKSQVLSDKYALQCYSFRSRFCNVGDYIQSIAAKSFLPCVDHWFCREHLSEYCGPEKIKMILNGWYMHHPENWPPSDQIDPLFVSFHINIQALKKLTAPKSLEYFKRHEPIGCRDHFTLYQLRQHGIEAYFSGCLTLTLEYDKSHSSEKNGEVLFVDVPNIPLENILNPDVTARAIKITHQYPSASVSEETGRFQQAEDLLRRYQNASLLVTSRLHCALPALAFETPVLFLMDERWNLGMTCRFEGLLKMLNVIYLTKDKEFRSDDIDLRKKIFMDTVPLNKTEHLSYRELLIKTCREFVGRQECITQQ